MLIEARKISYRIDALQTVGIGWGSIPKHMMQADLDAGRLVQLRIPEAKQRRLSFTSIFRIDHPPGPAGQWLIRRFGEQAETEAPHHALAKEDYSSGPQAA